MKLGIKTKLSLLTSILIFATLIISLSVSSMREIEFKKTDARKLMINLGKQIGLIKCLSVPISKNLIHEYLEKTVRSSLSRKGYAISIVYIISTDFSEKLELAVFNWSILKASSSDPMLLAEKILFHLKALETAQTINRKIQSQIQMGDKIQNVDIDLGQNGEIFIGFSLQILKSEIVEGIIEHISIGLILVIIGILTAILFSNKMTRPLLDIIRGFHKVSKGDFETQVKIHTHDELEQLSLSFNQMTSGLRERELIKDIFCRYATDQVVEKIMQSGARPTLSGELCEVTVLFSDIRMFTSLSSKLSPEKIVSILNLYFTAMTEIVIQNEGLLDKFTGDEIMVVFGAPIHHDDDPQRAMKTAFRMFEELKTVNQQLENEGCPKIEIGIGINTGIAVAGNVGSEKRMAYTVIGQDVNLAARLVSIAQKGEICLSESTHQKVGNIKNAVAETVSFKGLDQPVKIYRILSP